MVIEQIVDADGSSKIIKREECAEELKLKQTVLEENEKVLRIQEINLRLKKLTEDFAQVFAGALYDDIEERKMEFQSLHLELLKLLGKQPKVYKNSQIENQAFSKSDNEENSEK